MFICVSVYMHIYIFTYAYICVRVCVRERRLCVSVCGGEGVSGCPRVCMCVHTHTYMHKYAPFRQSQRAYMYIFIRQGSRYQVAKSHHRYTHIHSHIYIHTYIYILRYICLYLTVILKAHRQTLIHK